MTVNETIMNYLKERLNNEEFSTVIELTGLSDIEYDTFEDFKEQLNSDAIANRLKEDLDYISETDDLKALQSAVDYAQYLIGISKKLFYSNDK